MLAWCCLITRKNYPFLPTLNVCGCDIIDNIPYLFSPLCATHLLNSFPTIKKFVAEYGIGPVLIKTQTYPRLYPYAKVVAHQSPKD
jgi:hypothetical protein